MTPTIGRRELLAALGAAATWPLAARAQRAERMRRIGVLMNLASDDAEGQARLAAFHQGLQQARSIWETLSHTTGRLNRTKRTMRKTRNALLGILTMMSGVILAVPTEAAERYIPSVRHYKAVPERLFSYPYGGTYLRVDYAKRRFGYPYVGSYFGSYYAPRYKRGRR